jgi:NADH:ubiquinone oxidoreductase subunit 3 (subunit A)
MRDFQLSQYLPILYMFIVAFGFAGGNILLSQMVGQRKQTRTKLMPTSAAKTPSALPVSASPSSST